MVTPAPESAPEPLTWTVGNQQVTTVSDGRGGYEPGYNISFTLSNGHQDSVDVPAAGYSVANVRAAIQAKVDEVAGVYGLSGTAGEGS